MNLFFFTKIKRMWRVAILFLFALDVLASNVSIPSSLESVRLISEPILEHRTDKKLDFSIVPRKKKTQHKNKKIRKKFYVSAIELEGVHIFDKDDIADKCNIIANREMSLADLESYAECIGSIYSKHNYITSVAIVPAQKVSSGRVKIRVLEGYVKNILIEEENASADNVRDYLSVITSMKPLDGKRLENKLVLLNELPGTHVASYLSAAQHSLGASELNISNTFNRWELIASLDNYINKTYGHVNILAGAYLNLANLRSKTGLLIKASDKINRLGIYNISHRQYIGSNGLSFNLQGTLIRSRIFIGNTGIKNTTDSISSYINWPLIFSRTKRFSLQLNADLLSSVTDIGSYKGQNNDKVRSIRLIAELCLDDWLQGANTVQLGVSKGLPIFGATTKNMKKSSRSFGTGNYFKLTGNVSRRQKISTHFMYHIEVNGQVSPNTLLASEEFSFGGSNIGRGLESSTLVGANGLETKVELIFFNTNTVLGKLLASQYYIFSDLGFTWERHGYNDRYKSAGTIGFGTRWQFRNTLSCSIVFAQPIFSRGMHSVPTRSKLLFSFTNWF